MLDGLFQQALLAYTTAGEWVLDGLAVQGRIVLPLLVR
jgi:TetR/AcrR family transcriptional regulator, transcriptional repressor of bet genes